MIRSVFLLFLLLTSVTPITAFAQPAKEVPLDVRQLMTAREFEQSGLSKLSQSEIEALNRWVGNFAVQVYRTAQGGAGGCSSAIETQIDGTFEGWSGETIFKLMNGQIWQQSSYSYTYSYAYSPRVTIYPSSGGCKLQVEGVSDTISVRRIK